VLQELRRGRSHVPPVLVFVSEAEQHELSRVAALKARQDLGRFPARNFLVYLGGILALAVRDFLREDLQHTHTERVHVDLLVVRAFFVHVWGHEFRCSKHAEYTPVSVHGRQAEVADSQVAGRPVYENILALQVAVDNGRLLRVQVREAVQDLDGPPLRDLPSDNLDLRDEALQRPGRQNLGNEVDFLPLSVHPRSVEADDVVMMQPFQ